MYIDPWQWFRDFQHRAYAENNRAHMRLPEIYRDGWRYLEASRYEEAVRVFQEGVNYARRLALPMWEFFFESWVSEVYVLGSMYSDALRHSAQLVAKSVKPDYRDHPCRAVVYFTLAWVYYYIDPIGYHDEVLQALDAIENDMLLDEETHHRSIAIRAEIAYRNDNFEQARHHNARYMHLVQGNAFRESSGYGIDRALAYAEGNLIEALNAARLREDASRAASLHHNAVNSLLWQGVIQRYLGEHGLATQLIQRGIVEYEALNLPRQTGYYHILAEYHQVQGVSETELELRATAIKRARDTGSLSLEFDAYLDYIYLLNRMGRDDDDAQTSARAIADRSKRPAFYYEKLEAISAGKRFRYDWQDR